MGLNNQVRYIPRIGDRVATYVGSLFFTQIKFQRKYKLFPINRQSVFMKAGLNIICLGSSFGLMKLQAGRVGELEHHVTGYFGFQIKVFLLPHCNLVMSLNAIISTSADLIFCFLLDTSEIWMLGNTAEVECSHRSLIGFSYIHCVTANVRERSSL